MRKSSCGLVELTSSLISDRNVIWGSMAAECSATTLTERWIRDRLKLKRRCLGDVRSLSLPGTCEEKIRHLGAGLTNFLRLKSLDLSCNALVSLEGVQQLKTLERLILYNNCIPSLDEFDPVFELPALRELDLRLNPLTEDYPHYRPFVVQAMRSLRTLDGCSVRTSERSAARMPFRPSPQKSFSLDCVAIQRSSSRRPAVVRSLSKRLSDSNGSTQVPPGQHRSTPEQPCNIDAEVCLHLKDKVKVKSILRGDAKKHDKATSKPKVSFGAPVERHSPAPPTGRAGRGCFTPHPGPKSIASLSDPLLRPPPLKPFDVKQGKRAAKKNGGRYRRPLEMLLSLRDKHWCSLSSVHHNNNFLSPAQCLLILSLMESDLSSRGPDVKTLKQEVEGKLWSELGKLSNQLEESRSAVVQLSRQLKTVTEQKATLQKRLVRMERVVMKGAPLCQIKEVKELQKEVEGLREKATEEVHDRHRH